MRVLLVNHIFPPDSLGGVESYTQRLAADLVQAGDTVSVVTRRPEKSPQRPRILREQLPDGTLLYRIAGGNFVYEHYDRFLLYHDDVEQCFRQIMVEAAPDVVHFNHLLGHSPRIVEIAHRLRAAVVISLHDFYFACPRVHLQKPSGELCAGPDGGRECARTCFAGENAGMALRWGMRTAYFRRLLNMAHRLVAGSRYVASYFEEFAPHPHGVRVIPNGVAVEAVDPAMVVCSTPGERGRLSLAYCGSVARHKGVHVILDALRGADLGPVELLVIGQTPFRPYVALLREQAATVPGLNFRLYGEFKQAEFPYLLSDVDCAVTPSLVPEAGPQVPREVLARGVPVLASRLGALPEIVADGENGFTFDPSRPEQLAAILRRLLDDEDLLPRLRAGALRTPVVTMAEHTRAIRSVYRDATQDLLSNQRSRSADRLEIDFLHSALLSHGFARTG
jgi:glycosyltransferase involved in cell wall biosynthesis